MVARDAALAGYEGGRVHMQHLSCIESVRAVAQAKEIGVRVTRRGLAAPPVPHRRGGPRGHAGRASSTRT